MVLYLHQALDLLQPGPIRLGVQVLEIPPTLHRVILLGKIQE